MAGALTLSIMVLPTIIRSTEEALKAVSDSYREGSFGSRRRKAAHRISHYSPKRGFRHTGCGYIIRRPYCGRNSCSNFNGWNDGKDTVDADGYRKDAFGAYVSACKRRCKFRQSLCYGIRADRNRAFDQFSGQLSCEQIQKGAIIMNERFSLKNVNLFYGDHQALKNVNLELYDKKVTAFIGPSGCGKTTLLKALNRMNDLIEGCRITGEVLFDGEDIYHNDTDVSLLRKKVGMVFQKPNPFPMSVYDNIAFGPRTHGIKKKQELDEIVEKSLKAAAIWDEVKDRLKKNALLVSGGQQQRICIARALAVEPEVLLMDEPTSALDPISTMKIEDLIAELKEKYTIIIVTHNMQQATRISEMTAFFLHGEVIEYSLTDEIFSLPKDKRTEDYITGRFG